MPPTEPAKLLATLRETEKSLFGKRSSVEEGRLRVWKAKPVKPKSPLAPPKGKGGELWCKLRDEAITEGHKEPERLADAILRARELAQKIEADRHKLQKTDKVPTPSETVVSETKNAKRGRTLPGAEFRCMATKMDGKQCEFKRNPQCGQFCTKHAVNKNL